MEKPKAADFMFGSTLGEGAYARVVHARKKTTGEEFAVKIMEKNFIKREKKVKFVMMERKVYSRVLHERLVKLYFTFQDSQYLYFVMSLCTGGELLDLITLMRNAKEAEEIPDQACSFEVTQFFIAEIVQALEYLHTNDIIHRDLKPENILLTEQGHLKITDFGTAKDEQLDEAANGVPERTNTFCGTAEYVSPEVLRDDDVSRGCDLWALGCMVFQMLVGRPLFRAENEYLTFQQILTFEAEDTSSSSSSSSNYPPTFSSVAADLCNQLLRQIPTDRLGNNNLTEGYSQLKAHAFFDGIDWDQLSTQVSPYIPPPSTLPCPDNDGAKDDWLFAGVATELQWDIKSPREIMNHFQQEQEFGQQHPVASPLEGVDLLQETSFSSSLPSPPNTLRSAASPSFQMSASVFGTSCWNAFLTNEESISLCGLVTKRKGLFSKRRQLILTSAPRLIYIDPIRMKQKGEIEWSDHIYVQMKTDTTFDIVTPARVYHITDSNGGSQRWADAINHMAVSTSRNLN